MTLADVEFRKSNSNHLHLESKYVIDLALYILDISHFPAAHPSTVFFSTSQLRAMPHVPSTRCPDYRVTPSPLPRDLTR